MAKPWKPRPWKPQPRPSPRPQDAQSGAPGPSGPAARAGSLPQPWAHSHGRGLEDRAVSPAVGELDLEGSVNRALDGKKEQH